MSQDDMLSLAFPQEDGGSLFAVYRSRVVISPDKYIELDDVHKLHQLVLTGYGTFQNTKIQERVLYAAMRKNPSRHRNTQSLVAGEPHTILTQCTTPPDWSLAEKNGMITEHQTQRFETVWKIGDQFRMRVIAYPAVFNGSKETVMPIKDSAEAAAWLRKRMADSGGYIEPHEMSLQPFERISGKNGKISIASRTFMARGTVTDAEKFVQMLVGGLGRGKAWGQGLVLTQKV